MFTFHQHNSIQQLALSRVRAWQITHIHKHSLNNPETSRTHYLIKPSGPLCLSRIYIKSLTEAATAAAAITGCSDNKSFLQFKCDKNQCVIRVALPFGFGIYNMCKYKKTLSRQ